MRVEIIDYTGAESPDPLYAARLLAFTKNTRLQQTKQGFAEFRKMSEEQLLIELEYISKTIRSSWEFVDVTFSIQDVTRAFTHQLVRTRTASYAQQSQRSTDMSDFNVRIPETINDPSRANVWERTISEINRGYKVLREMGVPAQDARGLLPTNVLTNIIMKVNLRTLADLLAKRKGLRAQDEYAEVAAEMERAVLRIWPWAEQFLNPDRLRTPALDSMLKQALGSSSPVDKPMVNAALKELEALKGVWG
jgi:flavin-dependent thymidylate synthase